MPTGIKTFGEEDSIWFCSRKDCSIIMRMSELKKADDLGEVPWGSKISTWLKLLPLCRNHGVFLVNCPETYTDELRDATIEAENVVRSIMASEEEISKPRKTTGPLTEMGLEVKDTATTMAEILH